MKCKNCQKDIESQKKIYCSNKCKSKYNYYNSKTIRKKALELYHKKYINKKLSEGIESYNKYLERKKVIEYYKQNPTPHNIRYKNHHFKHQIKKKYNLTLEEYNNILLKQNNLCVICLNKFTDIPRSKAVDHNHKTGKVRGILCSNCNILLGHCNDNVTILQNAIKYLEENDY